MSSPPTAAQVLVVDDDVGNLMAVQAILEPLGQRVVVARSGEQALAATLEEEFAVVLMDVRLPGIDGFETAAAIRRSESGRRVPIIFLTGYDREPAQMARGYAQGGVDYLLKPYDAEILRAKVAVFIDLHLMREQIGELERDRALRAAAEAERARFYMLIMQSPVAIALAHGPEHVIELENAMFRGLHHRPPLVGKTVAAAFPELASTPLGGILDEVYRTGEPFAADELAVSFDFRGDGAREERWFKLNVQPLRDAADSIYGQMLVAIDVTAQVRARIEVEELRRMAEVSERYFRTLIDSIPSLAWSARADGFVDYYNQRWYAYTGTTPAEVEGWGWDRVQDPAFVTDVKEQWRRSVETGEPFEKQFPLRRADGVFRWHLTRVVAVRDGAGNIVRWVGTSTDIDDQQRAEQRLAEGLEREKQAREEAERAVQVNELFVGILGHDLRNPMSAIAMAGNLLLRTITNDKELKAATRIVQSSERMARMIDQVLDTTRVRSGGGLSLNLEPTDLAALCRRVVDELETARPNSRLSLNVGDGDAIGEWDADRLHQALSNVIGNAIDHGVGTAPISVRLERGDKDIAVWVHNRGVIPDEVLPVLFDPFRGSRRKGKKGLGLGLYITHQIVLAHGGSISVSSTEPDGTTFRIVLPRRRS